MDGLLVIDKPAGPTSHDVVARLRRVLDERRIGHTGTLDPMASGVLALVVGRATRLAQFLSAADKCYDAVVRLGVSTDSYDKTGREVGEPFPGTLPSREAIQAAFDRFRGTFLQQPPAFSAKKIDGERSYKLARKRAKESRPDRPGLPGPPDLPDPVSVTAHAIAIAGVDGALVSLRIVCSAGFYVRSLAHDLGQALGTGAHLTALRRTASGPATIADAVALDAVEREAGMAAARVIPLRRLLLDLPCAVLTPAGLTHVGHGRELGEGDFTEIRGVGPRVRLLDGAGDLVGIAGPGRTPGLLHPSIVLM
jgi:tRNA pseudouridine55 synthase